MSKAAPEQPLRPQFPTLSIKTASDMQAHTSPWMDRFDEPSEQDLLEALPAEARVLTDLFRQGIDRLPDMSCTVEWQGLPWRWVLTYDAPGVRADRAVAYLVPDPEAPRVAVPIDVEQVPRLLGPRSARTLREGVTHSSVVGDVVWTEWVLVTKVLTESLCKLVAATLEAPRKGDVATVTTKRPAASGSSKRPASRKTSRSR